MLFSKQVKILVAQWCLTPCNPMDCSRPGSTLHRDSLGKNTGVGCCTLPQGIFPTPGIKLMSPTLQADLYHLSHQQALSKKSSVLSQLDSFRETPATPLAFS